MTEKIKTKTGADRIFDHAFREACEDARARTELPLFYGQPEA